MSMKLVLAIIQPTRLEAVKHALYKVGVERLTVCDAQGFGRQRGQTETYRGREYSTRLLRKITLEIIVNDDFLDRTIDTLMRVDRSSAEGNIGDGKIFVLPCEEAIQIEDGARGPGSV
jgi:nitrogen regulatory protein P-II 2